MAFKVSAPPSLRVAKRTAPAHPGGKQRRGPKWFEENDPEGIAFEDEVPESTAALCLICTPEVSDRNKR
jgi:hypothetical protein